MTDKKPAVNWKAEAEQCRKEKTALEIENVELRESALNWKKLASVWRSKAHNYEDRFASISAREIDTGLGVEEETLTE